MREVIVSTMFYPEILQIRRKTRKLNNVSKIFTCPGEPPVSAKEDRQGEPGKIREPGPVRHGAIEEDKTITSNQRREGIQVDNRAVGLRNNRLWINDRSKVHPS